MYLYKSHQKCMVFKAMRLNKLTQEVKVDKNEKRFLTMALQNQPMGLK